jgi:hypothetical protein
MLVAFCPYMYYSFSMYVEGRANKPYPDYDWAEMSDLWITAITATIQVFLKRRIVSFMKGIVAPFCKN